MMTAFPHIAIQFVSAQVFFGYDVGFVDVVKFDYRNFVSNFV